MAEGASLKTVAGRQRGSVWPLERGVVRLGRAADCDIPLDDALASRHHAEIHVAAHGLRIRDLGSTNKTMVNGSPISEAPLNDGDQVQIGNTRLQVVLGGAPRAAAPPPRPPSRQVTAPPGRTPPPKRRESPSPAAKTPPPGAKEPAPSRSGRVRFLAVILVVVILGFAAVILLTSREDSATGPAAGGGATDPPDSGPAVSFPTSPDGARSTSSDTVYPENAVALFEEGFSLFQYGRLVRAREVLEAALQIAPDYQEAQDVLRRTESAIDARVEASMQRARSAMGALRYEEARRALQEVFFLLEEGDDRLVEAQRIRDRIGQ